MCIIDINIKLYIHVGNLPLIYASLAQTPITESVLQHCLPHQVLRCMQPGISLDIISRTKLTATNLKDLASLSSCVSHGNRLFGNSELVNGCSDAYKFGRYRLT